MSDPVDPQPTRPLVDSYSYHSPLPTSLSTDAEDDEDEGESSTGESKRRGVGGGGWMLGIDEAGRGPVLGPMVYAAAYCPLAFKPELEELGFDDSKILSNDTRDSLWNAFKTYEPLCYSSRTLSPQDISSGMLRRNPFNLNRQAEEATIGLIRDALARGVDLREVYVDALGPAAQWQSRLSQIFPTLSIKVEAKADSTYKIVGAASIIAKVTRDRWMESWLHPEGDRVEKLIEVKVDVKGEKGKGKGKAKAKGKGSKRKGKATVQVVEDDQGDTEPDDADELDDRPRKKRRTLAGQDSEGLISGMLEQDNDLEEADVAGHVEDEDTPKVIMREERGSGYPSDPKTQSYLRTTFSPIFGYPQLVRFSWAGPKLQLEKDAVGCKWIDEVDPKQGRLVFGAGGPAGDKGRSKMWKDLGLAEVGEL